MKKNLISVALFAVLATMAVSCQKENIMDPQSTVAEISTVRTVLYAVDGVEHRVTLHGDDEWTSFVESMISLSEQGHCVRIINEDAATHRIGTKDVQTLTTSSQATANAWVKEKADAGYSVSVTYENGQYSCMAIS